ncbi:class I adenylate-forming enzyme family protein [Actinomycetospora rhizophila]|uniref:Class I adenylate-forming enzyme family protein n=1 Tax=Actinomycetospora rhizophila TaxID=1416876 RepID=A0ABV9ZCQ9_9PSEU
MTVPAPAADTLGGLVAELAARWPGRPAVVHQGVELTFAALDAEVDAWARALLALGVRHGESVAVLIGNRPEWLVATVAAARIGALVTPVNTWYREDELTYALEHSRAVVLITAAGQLKQDFTALVSAVRPGLPSLRTVVGIDASRPADALSRADFLTLGETVTDEDLAAARARVGGGDDLFLLYTSGSTARPKGVLLGHHATIANDFAIGERMGLDPTDRAWVAIPLFYGFAAVNAVVAVWSHGGALVLQESFDADAALDLIASQRATVYYGLGNMTRALLAANAAHPRDISSLRKGLTGYSYEDKRLVVEDLGVTGCCSIYGLTESHGLAAMTDHRDPVEVRLTSDGRALPGWELRVVDPVTEEPVAVGETGHLLIRGFLTRGYLGDPGLTASVLTADGFFRTGDLVRVDEGGALHFHSRLKEVIKTGGINVSPLEVEHVLESHPAVSLALAFGVPDAERGEAVVAVVALADGASVTEEELRAHVKGRAAGFKVPRRTVFRSAESLPRLASGKVARRALRDEVLAVTDP